MDKKSLDMRVVVDNRDNSMMGDWNNNWHSVVGMVDHRDHRMMGMVDHGFVNNRCSIGRSWHNGWSISRRRCTIGRLLHMVGSLRRVLGHPFIGHLSYIPIVVIGGVVHVLNPSVGKRNRVGALP